MIDKSKFCIRRKCIAVLALLCMMLVSCGGDPVDTEKADSTDPTPVSSNVVTAVTTAAAGNSASAEDMTDGAGNAILDGEEIPLTEEIPVTVVPSVTEEPSADGSEKNEVKDPAKTDKTDGTSAIVKGTDTVTTKPQGGKADDTEATTTTPLIQVLPDGGILLPDDEWE